MKLDLVKIKARKGETTVDAGPSRLGVSEALPGQDQGEEGRDHCGYWALQIRSEGSFTWSRSRRGRERPLWILDPPDSKHKT